MPQSSKINTAKATRRPLRFETIDDVRREIDRIIAAECAGTLCSAGNWTPGQAFGHLAAWINYAWEGYPPELRPNWAVRFIMRRLVRKIARSGYPSGSRIPSVENGTFATEPLSTEVGAKQLREALDRLESPEPAKFDSPAFGRVEEDVRVALQLRHAELHLGYFLLEAA